MDARKHILGDLLQQGFCFSVERLNRSLKPGRHFDSRGYLNAGFEKENKGRVLEVGPGHDLKDNHVHGH
jgi:hypothetical protein